jgi:ankyrin repeat protein
MTLFDELSESDRRCLFGGIGMWSRDECGRTLLHVAAEKGLTKIVRSLVYTHRANVHTIADRHPLWSFTSPLYAAVSNDHLDVAQILLDRGANLTDVNPSDNNSLLHLAARRGNVLMVRALLKRSAAKVYAKNNLGETPLYYAIKHTLGFSSVENVVKILLQEGADPNAINSGGETVFHHAVRVWLLQDDDLRQEYYENIVCPLLQYGADPFVEINAFNALSYIDEFADDKLYYFQRLCHAIQKYYDARYTSHRFL